MESQEENSTVATWTWIPCSLGDIQPWSHLLCYYFSVFCCYLVTGRRMQPFPRIVGCSIFPRIYIERERDYWSFSLIRFWWCFQGQRNNLLLIPTLRSCQCDLMFIFSQKLHWFSALIFLHLYIIWIQKCVNDTWIVPPVLTCWKY